MVKFIVNSYIPIVKQYLLMCIKSIILEISKGNLQNYAFLISFNKNDENVIFPPNISNEDIVTIVLQNQYWDLSIDQSGFEVVLDFFGERQTVYISFSSIVLLADSVSKFYIDLRDFMDVENGDLEIDSDDEHEDDSIIEVDLSKY